jgi:hypothetical protein
VRRDIVAISKDADSIVHLVPLDGSVDEETDIVQNEADDLNRVLHAQGIVDKKELVDVSEHKHCKICWDSARFAVSAAQILVKADLEFSEDVSVGGVLANTVGYRARMLYIRFEGQGNDRLGDGGDHEGPGPFRVGDIHSGSASGGRWKIGRKALAVVVSTRRLSVGLVARARELGLVVSVQRLASEEGCSRLVVGNFGRMVSRELAAEARWL